ncbi:MAG: ppGpp synthetase/RelA/SpoT-type nucleotidyltransferase [Verrucomicrobiales bacterium]|jgi:ppGpp synthetase/RelA/SpoT-type nucleotidyltranferase
MIIPAQVRQLYEDGERRTKLIASRVKERILPFCENKGFAFASRVKDLTSVAEKIESGRYRSWAELDDLFACTIVIPDISREQSVIDFLLECFQKVEIRKRGAAFKAPECFRFDSTRFIGALQPSPVSSSNAVPRMRFEVQIRTAFEHAWSVTMHALVYKTDSIDWRALRLGAQLKASVEQLDTLVLAFEKTSSTIPKSTWPDVSRKQKIVDVLKSALSEGYIPSECAPKDWSRASENIYSLLKASSSWPSERSAQKKFFNDGMKVLKDELSKADVKSFPRSVSMFQQVMGLLWQRGIIGPKISNFTPPITPELTLLYPGLERMSAGFDFS